MILKDFLQNLILGHPNSVNLVAASCRDDLKLIRELVINEMKIICKKDEINCFSVSEDRIIINENKLTKITILFKVINKQDSVKGMCGIWSILEFNLSIPSTELLRSVIRDVDCKIFTMEKE